MTPTTTLLLQVAAGVLMLLLLPGVWRVLAGPANADRLQGFEIVTTLLVGLLILQDVLNDTTLLTDVSLALVAFAFIATMALARYLAEGRMF